MLVSLSLISSRSSSVMGSSSAKLWLCLESSFLYTHTVNFCLYKAKLPSTLVWIACCIHINTNVLAKQWVFSLTIIKSSLTCQMSQVAHLDHQSTKKKIFFWDAKYIQTHEIWNKFFTFVFMVSFMVNKFKREKVDCVHHNVPVGGCLPGPGPLTLSPSRLLDAGPPGSCWGPLRSHSSAGLSGSSAASV